MFDFELPQVLRDAPGMRAAQLVIDGLAVLRFNSGFEKFWEVAYPRKAGHTLRIRIADLDANDRPIYPPIVDEEVDRDRKVRSFNISLTDGSVTHYERRHFPLGGPRADNFNRRRPNNNDPHDLGWMIDLADIELKHGNATLRPQHPSRPISLARIRHSLLCTLEPDDKPVRISPIRRDDPTHFPDSFELGRTNTEMVGVLLANGPGPGEIRFEFDPPGSFYIQPLQYSQNKRYQIEMINDDDEGHGEKKGFVRGDLRRFYDDVIEVDGTPKDLWAKKPNRPDRRVFPDGDCHVPEFGGGSLEALLTEELTAGASRQAAKKSTKRSAAKATKKSTKRSAAKATKKSTKRSAAKATKKSTKRSAAKATKKSTKRSAAKPAKKSTKRKTTKAGKKSRGKSKAATKKYTKGRSKRR
jgi:hypothetical protein